MENFAIRTVVNSLALWAAAWIVPGITLGGTGDTFKNVWTTALVAVVFGVINAFLKPITTILSIPFIVITLGLFLFVINALMLSLTSWIAGGIGLPFNVDEFWWSAIWGGLIIAIVSGVANALIDD